MFLFLSLERFVEKNKNEVTESIERSLKVMNEIDKARVKACLRFSIFIHTLSRERERERESAVFFFFEREREGESSVLFF
jgi:hypothetical protein